MGAGIGRSRVLEARGCAVDGDAVALLLEVHGRGMVDHAIVVFIDDRHGGRAKHLGLIYGRGERDPDDQFWAMSLEPRDAGRRVIDAIALTDAQPDAPVGEDFATLRLMALARAASALSAGPPSPSMN